jgi:peptidoglycan/LPS O-acetylase OafA/YrhL
MASEIEPTMDTDDDAEGLDVDGDWADARAAAGLEIGWVSVRQGHGGHEISAEVSPYVLLYSGFLLGPAASLLVALILLARRFEARAALFSVGVCGAAWGVIQAATFGLAGQWTTVELQILRTVGNFLVGVTLLAFLRKYTAVPFGHDRQTLINTVVIGVLMVIGYASMSPETLVWLGR